MTKQFLKNHPYEVYLGDVFEGRFSNLALAATTAHHRSIWHPFRIRRNIPLPVFVLCEGHIFTADDCRKLWEEWWNRQQMITRGAIA